MFKHQYKIYFWNQTQLFPLHQQFFKTTKNDELSLFVCMLLYWIQRSNDYPNWVIQKFISWPNIPEYNCLYASLISLQIQG